METEVRADKYFYIFKMGLETGLPRLMNDILVAMQRLITFDCLVGDGADNCIYPADKKPPEKNGRLPRILMDAIADAVMECAQDSDNQVQLQVIKILLTIVIAVNSRVHELTLLAALRTQYSIFMTSTSQTNQKTAKAASTQMINTVFQRMDVYQRHGTNSSHLDLRRVESRLSAQSLEKSLTKKNEESKDDTPQPSADKSEPIEVAFAPLDLYVHGLVRNMVDNVCLYEARVDQAKSFIPDEEAEAMKAQIPQEYAKILQEKIAKIPLNPIPGSKKETIPEVDIQNELGFPPGKFGWCISCRKAANVWCKDTLHPVCSEECKKKHWVEANSIDVVGKSDQPNFVRSKEASIALTDAHLVFRSIVKLATGDAANNGQLNRFAIKTKILGLEFILTVLQNPKPPLLTRKEFIDVIKNQLCDGLLRYSVTTELVIFQLVIDIFYNLFLSFRQHLKQIIRIFIETIFLKLLDSSNSSYQHKTLILGVFDKISKRTKMLLEIFVNYDCDISQKDLSMNMIETLCRIANGKFAKSEHQTLISAQESTYLKNYATQILVQILRSFNGTIDAKIAESKITTRLNMSQSQTNHEEQWGGEESATPSQQKQAVDSNQKIEQRRNQKQELTKAANKFNLYPKHGIKYLVDKELIPPADEMDAHVKGIVKFLKTTPVLDKTAIGEFLGKNADLNRKCLTEFIFEYNLKNMEFVSALRTILQGFRIPGEGQIVDVIMETFGLKFVRDNPDGSDGCQDTMTDECVYLLSYATMMMQTSLHNPNAIKTRMTLEDFAKMIKGINNGKNLEPEFIKKIFETVEREPFTLNEDDDARFKLEAQNATTYKRKQELFQKESMSIFERGKNEMQGSKNSAYISVDDVGPIRPMFEQTWSANLATLSILLDETADEQIAALCIEGFILSIKICGFFSMKTERDAFVSSFAKFTLVTSDKRLKPKNIACIQSLIELATYQGNYLGESWYFVLECVSCLEELINLGSGQAQDKDFFDPHAASSHRVPRSASVSGSGATRVQKEAIMSANSELVVQAISIEQIDQIFQNSVNLDPDAIIHFIDSLSKCSKRELNDLTNPRKFSLQALVEIADLNMVRIRFVWSKIWEMLSDHFVQVGSHQNLMVAIFAIDSLRQLADKFLMRDEFQSFKFQAAFLRPFEQIMLNNMHTRSEIKEYIVTCITRICETKTAYIQSGWEVIINIFTLSAQDTEQQLVKQSFQALKKAVTNHFDLLQSDFVNVVNCLNKYSLNQRFAQQAIEAQELTCVCADRLQDPALIDYFVEKKGNEFFKDNQEAMNMYPPQYGLAANLTQSQIKVAGDPVTTPDATQAKVKEVRLAVLKCLWFPLLQNTSNLVIEKSTPEKQQKAMDNFFRLLEKAAKNKNHTFWREVFAQVLFPVLEDIKLAVENGSDDEQFQQATFEAILQRFNHFFSRFYEQLPNVIPVYIDIICLFISEVTDAKLAKKVIEALHSLLKIIGGRLQTPEWEAFTTTLCLCFDVTLPRQLTREDPGDLNNLFTKCCVQIWLINTVQDVLKEFHTRFTSNNIREILACLDATNQFAKAFNQNVAVRRSLWERGFMKGQSSLPGLITQEYKSLAIIIQTRFILYFRQEKLSTDVAEHSDADQLIQMCTNVLNDYQLKSREQLILESSSQASAADTDLHANELKTQLQNLTPIISTHILKNLQKLQDSQLRKNLKNLSPVAIELTLCPDQEVRTQNKELLSRMFHMLL